MKTLQEQFAEAPKRCVVPLIFEDIYTDPRYLPVERYPFMLVPVNGEVGLLGRMRGRIVSAVYERIICHSASLSVTGCSKGVSLEKTHGDPESLLRYVAESVPGQRFLDSRGQ